MVGGGGFRATRKPPWIRHWNGHVEGKGLVKRIFKFGSGGHCFYKAVFTPQVWDWNRSGTVPIARVQTCSTASCRSGTSRPPRDVIAVERFRNGSGWLCGVNARQDPFRNRSSCPWHSLISSPFFLSPNVYGILPHIVWSAATSPDTPMDQRCEQCIAVAVCLNFERSGHYDISAH